MLEKETILQNLNQINGSEEIYRHPITKLLYASGIRYIIESCEASWLINEIMLYQLDKIVRQDRMLQEFQIWELKVEKQKGILTLKRDTNDIVFKKFFSYTSFPLDEIKFYFENKTLMLPNER